MSTQLPVKSGEIVVCDICHYPKQRRTSVPISLNRATAAFELLHLDIWRPYSIASIHGHKYFLIVVDDYTRFTRIILMKGKFEVQKLVKKFLTTAETQFSGKIKQVRTDNGPEFMLTDFYASKGIIIRQTSCVATPQ